MKQYIYNHIEQYMCLIGGTVYALFNISIHAHVMEYVMKIMMAAIVGFATAFGAWVFKLIVKKIRDRNNL